MTSTRDALVAAVLAAPADDLPRLVFADWLEEHGEGERAGYIRAQVEVAREVAADRLDSDEYLEAAFAVAAVRLDKLWRWAADDGLPVLPLPGPAKLVRSAKEERDGVSNLEHQAGLSLVYRRGFVEAVRCGVASWQWRGPGFVARAPVERVEVTDRRPLAVGRLWAWLPDASPPELLAHALPPAILDRLPAGQRGVPTYPTREQAEAALSAACLAFARG